MTWTTYKEKVRAISERLVEIQKPIRVLDAIKWDAKIEQDFFAAKCKKMPKVDRNTYAANELGFDPEKKADELQELKLQIGHDLDKSDALAHLLVNMVEQYQLVVEMLAHRGQKEFYKLSRELYGSPKDTFFDDKQTIRDMGHTMYSILSSLEGKELGKEYPKVIPAEDVVRILNERFANSFLKDRIEVKLSDGIVADASAGSDVIKIKEGAMFSAKDIDIFEVHEGWVHVATTANGKNQKVSKWLSKGPPRCASTQEGLAMLMEIFTFSTYPRRARSVNDRILGIDKAEDGANFLDLFEFYQTEGYEETEAFRNSMRVFRGGVVEGGAPFTKDISYCRGFVENYNFLRTAIRYGKPEIIPFLFAGKLNVEDVPLLYAKSKEGVVDAPLFLPPQFADLNGLAVWMSYSNFFNTVNLKEVQDHYTALFRKYL